MSVDRASLEATGERGQAELPPQASDFTNVYEAQVTYPPLPSKAHVEAYRSTRALRTPPRADINLHVPFIHQLWDTPDSFNGHWACGPTCAAMVLAYYGLLEPKPIEVSKPHPHTSDYGWYIMDEFSITAPHLRPDLTHLTAVKSKEAGQVKGIADAAAL